MKNYLLYLMLLFVGTNYSQVVYTETFTNYTQGNVGTDPNGVTPGQGGWLTQCTGNTPKNNSLFSITNETVKGNVLTLSSGTVTPTYIGTVAKKVDLNTLIDKRTAGYNVLKFEIDYYTGAQQPGVTYIQQIILGFDAANPFLPAKQLFAYSLWAGDGFIGASIKDVGGFSDLDKNTVGTPAKLPFSTWVTFIVYLDYTNKKAYFETPYFNTITVKDFLAQSTSTNLIEDFKPEVLALTFSSYNQTTTVDMLNKYDNIKITALKSVPAYVLSTESVLATQFNLYPNPATSVVNINSAENKPVSKVVVYDVTGKLLSTHNFNNQTNIQLNTESLASGTYMLHIETTEGTAVKKLVKK